MLSLLRCDEAYAFRSGAVENPTMPLARPGAYFTIWPPGGNEILDPPRLR